MTDEEIIRRAREAGLVPAHPALGLRENQRVALKSFAESVKAAAVAEEREGCARLIEETREWKGKSWTSMICPVTTGAIATAVRARGQKEGAS